MRRSEILEDLARRVAASRSSRYLDALIYAEVILNADARVSGKALIAYPRDNQCASIQLGEVDPERHDKFMTVVPSGVWLTPHYTGIVEVAATLVPGNFDWCVTREEGMFWAGVGTMQVLETDCFCPGGRILRGGYDPEKEKVRCQLPAIALCSAALWCHAMIAGQLE